MTEFKDPSLVCLNCLLGDWYVSVVIKNNEDVSLVQDFDAQTKIYPNLRGLAEARLGELDALARSVQKLEQRCMISHIHRQYLQKVLRNDRSQEGDA